MGNTHNPSSLEPEYEEELEYYLSTTDVNLGQCKIYTSRKMPLCYILKYQRNVSDSKIYNLFSKIEQVQSNALLSLYGFRIDRNNCCNNVGSDRITAYWEYYNFYFAQYLKKRSGHGCMFLDTELWHLVEVVVQAYSVFRKLGIHFDVDPEAMVVTPEGKLKVCWAHLKSHNNHMKFIQFFEQNHTEKFFYSPEELEYMYLGQRTLKLDFDKANTFRLGMILLECLILMDPIPLCYNPSFTKINFHVVKNLIQTKVAPSYPEEFVSFLRQLLKQSPKQRPTLMDINERYNHMMNPEYELRVCGKGPKQSEDMHQNFRQQMFRKKTADISDTKTVKLNHSVRKG